MEYSEEKYYNDTKEFINNLNKINNDEIDVISSMINNQIQNLEGKKELIELWVNKIKQIIIENPQEYTKEEIKNITEKVKNKFTYDELNNIIYPLNFTVEDINQEIEDNIEDVEELETAEEIEDINEEQVITNNTQLITDDIQTIADKREINIIKKRIKHLKEKQNGILTIDDKQLLTKKDIEEKIKDLNEERLNLWNLAENEMELTEQDHKKFHKIDELIKILSKELNNEYYEVDTESLENRLKKIKDYDLLTLTNEEIDKQIQKLEKDYKDLWIESTHGIGLSEDDEKRIEEIPHLIEQLKNTKKYKDYFKEDEIDKQIQKLEEDYKDLWMESSHGIGLSEDDEKRIEEIPNLIEQLNKQKKINLKNKVIEIRKQIEQLEKEQSELYREEVHGIGLSEEDNKKYEQNNKKLSELKKILDVYNIIELKEEINKRKNSLTLEEIEELKLLEEIEKAYTTIIEDTEQKFKNNIDEDNIKDKIIEYVNNHPMIESIEKYNNAEKLKKELLEDIFKKLNIKQKKEENEIAKKDNKKALLYKALATVAGFAAGLGMSCVPGVGTIRMVVAGTKLTTNIVKSSVNLWTKKHPDGKIDNIQKVFKAKVDELNNTIESKYPNITSKIKNLKAKLKESPLNCFVNGVAVGYIVGNIFEAVTGENILKHFTKANNDQLVLTATETVSNTGTVTEAATEAITNTPDFNINDYLNNTRSIDLRGISQGYVSSDGINPVNLITSSGEDAVFDKMVTNSLGEKMVHFKQADGKGYAWFKLEDIEEFIKKLVETAGKVGRGR